jgi:hypothetical protein
MEVIAAAFVLIVHSSGYSGSVAFQEFTTRDRCEAARVALAAMSRVYALDSARSACVPR